MEKLRKSVATSVAVMFFLGAISIVGMAQSAPAGLRTLDGKIADLNEQRGKIIVLSFSGTWVPLASKEVQTLQKLADRYSSRGVQVYWVSINSDKQGARNYASDADLQAFAQKNSLRLTILRDPEMQAYRSFGLDAVPTVVIVDQNGKFVRKHVGMDPDQTEGFSAVMRDLEQLLK